MTVDMTVVGEPDIVVAHADLGPPRAMRADPRPAMSRLLSERDDLRGVYPTADYLAESIRWSA